MEDQELVLGCLEGRKEVWEKFVQRFSKLVYWSIWQTIENAPLGGADDFCAEVYQDVFKKLLERDELCRLRDAKSLPKFLSILACHTAMDKLKSLGRYGKKTVAVNGEEANTTFLDVFAKDPRDCALSKEKEILVAATLEKLAPKERFCIEYHYLDGKTHREISLILGMPQDTVSTVIRRAREKLQKDFLRQGLLE